MKTKTKKIYSTILIMISFALFLLLETELTLNKTESIRMIQWGIKFCIGLISVLLSIPMLLKEKNRKQSVLSIVLFFFLLGDTSINLSFLAGGILFSIGHILLLVCLLYKSRPVKGILIVFGITYLVFLTLNLCFLNKNGVLLTAGFLIYSLIISLLEAISIRFNNQIRIGVLLFVLSDFMLMLNIGLGNSLMFGHFARFIYYSSVMVLATAKLECNDNRDI